MWNDDIKLLLAPMAGFTDQPFRRLARKHGADEVVTELLSANALVRDSKRTYEMMRIHPEERPATVQIFGSDPDSMAEAARRAEETGCEYIDINMGCPAKKVVRNGAGSALLANPVLATKIIEMVVKAVKIPVSIKIRTGRHAASKTGMEIAERAADTGVFRVSIHARTVADGFSGPIDYDFVAEVKKRVSVEVIGNGDIHSSDDARKWISRTGCDGLMIGRGAIGHPSIFQSIKENVVLAEVEPMETIISHLEWMKEYYGEERAVGPMRGHLMYYSRGIPTARQFRSEINDARSAYELKKTIKMHFGHNVETVICGRAYGG